MHNLIAALTLETFSVAKPPDTGNYQKAWIAQSESNPTETPRIGTYASPGPLNQESNTYWVETADGVVVIEAQWVLPEAQNAIEAIRASTDSPLAAIFITHPHSDYFGGINAFVETAENNLPIYACYLTLTSIRNDSEGFISQRQEAFGDDFSNPVTLPNQIVEDGDEIEFGEVNFRILEFPHNESLTMKMPYLPEQGVLFSGDLVGNQRTPVLREGLTAL